MGQLPHINEILLADTNAATATAQAVIATTQAGIATTKASDATAQAVISTTQAGIATTKAAEATAVVASVDTPTILRKDSSTGMAFMPAGTTAQRPVSGLVIGSSERFNTTLNRKEIWNGTVWVGVGGGATGGSTDEVFVLGSFTVTSSYTVPDGRSAIVVGDANGNLTINDGVVITIPNNSRMVVL